MMEAILPQGMMAEYEPLLIKKAIVIKTNGRVVTTLPACQIG
jgi:hypothetical protein